MKSKLEKGDRFRVLERKPGSFIGERQLESGETEIFEGYPLEDGKPVFPDANIVTTKHLGDDRYEIADEVSLGHKGPAKVATKKYRYGYDRIFGAKPDSTLN